MYICSSFTRVRLPIYDLVGCSVTERKPGRPENVTVSQLPDGGLLISWSPASRNSSSPAQYYVVEYRTVGPWVRLSGALAGGSGGGTPDFRWTTASRGATYHFRVLAYGADDVASEPSDFISLYTGGNFVFIVAIGTRRQG